MEANYLINPVEKNKHSAPLHWYFIGIVGRYHIKRSDSSNPEGSFCFGCAPRGACNPNPLPSEFYVIYQTRGRVFRQISKH